MVPHWVRGAERLEMILPWPRELPMLGLGFSVGTPMGGIRGEVLVVNSFEELERRADEAKGRIVLFNVPVHDVRADRPVSLTGCCGRRTGGRCRKSNPLGHAVLTTNASHRELGIRRGSAEDSARRDHRRGRRPFCSVCRSAVNESNCC